MRLKALVAALAATMLMAVPAAAQRKCDAVCLDKVGQSYLAAYLKRDPKAAPLAPKVRFTENNVDLSLPEGSWETVTSQAAPEIRFVDPASSQIGMYLGVMMGDVPAFLAIRLKTQNGKVTEAEHLLSTKRLVSGPPTPFGDVAKLVHDPEMMRVLSPGERRSRDELIRVADGYFQTLSRNDGTLHTKFADRCHRFENGMETAADGCATGFREGRFRFNERVRRAIIMVDEARGLVMARGFIDHKGTLDRYMLTTGVERRSPFREPHTWSFIETFKISDGAITSVEADFIGSPYKVPSPWGTDRQ